MKKGILLVMLAFLLHLAQAQPGHQPKLLAGPVIGAVTGTTAKIWIAYRGKGQNLLILGDTAEERVYYPTDYHFINNSKGDIALTMDFKGLKPGHRYNILTAIDGWGSHAKYSFVTQSDSGVTDINFLLGSCNLMQTDFSRIIFPGGSNWIFYRMKKKKSDFMVWLGDNIYYLYPREYRSYEDMFNHQLKIRKVYNKFYRDFLGNQPNYAIWDDHDFGPNNCCSTFRFKDTSLAVFKGFWPNAYPEQPSLKGNFFSFKQSDAEFFMTDCRYHRDPQGDTSGAFLGEIQIAWLKNKLQTSDATFKFIAIGSQVLNDNGFDESYADFQKERNDLLSFIADNNIKGVVFLTGDKHYSEICKRDWHGYPLYDITSSPLTSPPLLRRLFGAYKNQWRVKGTDYGRKNFGRITITGAKGDRNMKIETFGRGGYLKRTYNIHQSELMKK